MQPSPPVPANHRAGPEAPGQGIGLVALSSFIVPIPWLALRRTQNPQSAMNAPMAAERQRERAGAGLEIAIAGFLARKPPWRRARGWRSLIFAAPAEILHAKVVRLDTVRHVFAPDDGVAIEDVELFSFPRASAVGSRVVVIRRARSAVMTVASARGQPSVSAPSTVP